MLCLTVKAALISTKKPHLETHLAVSNWQTLAAGIPDIL